MGFDHPSWLLFAIPVGLLWHLFHHRRKVLNRWRAAILILVVLAFAGLYMRLPRPGGMVVVLADRSASLPENATDLQMEAIRRLQQEMAPRQQLAVVSFGGRAAVEQQPHSGAFNGFTLDLGRDQTRLADALELGTSLVPDGVPARFLVLGDGQWTGRDPLNAARQAALRDIAVDYRVLNRDTGRDLSIHSIDAPQSVAQGQSFLIHAWIDAPDTLEGTYALERNGQRIASGTRTLEQGLNHLVFRDRLAASGPAAYRLAINGEATDPVPENNRARFIVGSDGKLPVLLLSTTANGALDRLLEETGMQVDTRDPAGFDWSLESLSRYSGVVIENVSAGDLGTRGMELLASWVEATGHGLFMTGGKRSYGAGGFFQSPLERIMPVSMELRREHRKLALAIAVVLDRSGSMSAPVSGGKTKMDLANIGTVQVLDLLSDMDELGVLAVDSAPHTILDLKPVDQCRPRRNDILKIESMGGGIYVYEGLLEASKMLLGSKAGTRHIILFSDAADSEQPGNYKALLEQNRLANITVSVVALGNPTDSDADLLRDIAARGEGEIYFTQDATEVPRIFAQDTFAVARSTFLEDPTGMEWTPLMSLVSGGKVFDPAPALGGYNLSYLREGAQLLAVSADEYAAPLVAAWQAGSGRVLCYAGEVDGIFTGSIGQWTDYGAFIAGMARWAAGSDSSLPEGILPVQEVRDGVCRISLHLDPDRQGELFTGEPAIKVLRSQPGKSPATETYGMRWASADLLELELPLEGEETILASIALDGFQPVSLPPVCLPYSPEFVPRNPASGLEELKRIASVSGGREQIDVGKIWNELPRDWQRIPLRAALLLLAVLLFLVEIVERRVGIGFRNRIPQLQKTSQAPAPKVKSPGKIRGKKVAVDKPKPPAATTENPFKDAQSRARQRFRP